MPFSRACRLIQRSLLITDTPCSDRTACRDGESSLGKPFPRRTARVDRQVERPTLDPGPAEGPLHGPGDRLPAVPPHRREHGGAPPAHDAAERARPAPPRRPPRPPPDEP